MAAICAALTPVISSISSYRKESRGVAREHIVSAILAHIAPSEKNPTKSTSPFPVSSNTEAAKILLAAGFDTHGSVTVHVPVMQRRGRVLGKLTKVLHALDLLDPPHPVKFLKAIGAESGFLSPWLRASFTHNAVKYHCSEQWVQAEKARLFGDKETLARIMLAHDARQSRDISKYIRGFHEDRWNAHVFAVMFEGNIHKFMGNEELLLKLLSFGLADLINTDGTDFLMGYSDRDREGQNLLGKAVSASRLWLVNEFCRFGYFDTAVAAPATEYDYGILYTHNRYTVDVVKGDAPRGDCPSIRNPVTLKEFEFVRKGLRDLGRDAVAGNTVPPPPQGQGQTLAEVAAEYGISFEVLRAANPNAPATGSLPIGEKIRIPRVPVADVEPPPLPPPPPPPPPQLPDDDEGIPKGLLDDEETSEPDLSTVATGDVAPVAKTVFEPQQIVVQTVPLQYAPPIQPQVIMMQQPMNGQQQVIIQQPQWQGQQQMMMQQPQQVMMQQPQHMMMQQPMSGQQQVMMQPQQWQGQQQMMMQQSPQMMQQPMQGQRQVMMMQQPMSGQQQMMMQPQQWQGQQQMMMQQSPQMMQQPMQGQQQMMMMQPQQWQGQQQMMMQQPMNGQQQWQQGQQQQMMMQQHHLLAKQQHMQKMPHHHYHNTSNPYNTQQKGVHTRGPPPRFVTGNMSALPLGPPGASNPPEG